MMTRWFNSLPYVSPIVNEFIITVKTDNAGVSASNEILLPIQGTNMVIDWGDGSVSTHTQTATPNNTIGGNNVVKTYASAGVYQIKISPSILRLLVNNGGDRLKFLECNNWGKAIWGTDLFGFFRGCSNLDVKATDVPDLRNTISLQQFFSDCTSLIYNPSINNWKFPLATNIAFFFSGCTLFNQRFDGIFAPNLITIQSFLSNNSSFNQPLNGLNVANVTNMVDSLTNTQSLRHDVGEWVLNQNVNMSNMFFISNLSNSIAAQEMYSRTLIGWANNIFERGGVVSNPTLGFWGNRRYNNINYVSGQQFNNAVDARNYLVNTLGWTITGDAQV